jgi:hypothetical protein
VSGLRDYIPEIFKVKYQEVVEYPVKGYLEWGLHTNCPPVILFTG